MTEKQLQDQCIEYLKYNNIAYYHSGFRGLHKYGYSKNTKGYPDLFIFMPGGKTIFVELKQPKKKASIEQVEKIMELSNLGFKCFVIDSFEKFVEAIKWG
jgi:hypothetical protein